jgi:hypothetical protein
MIQVGRGDGGLLNLLSVISRSSWIGVLTYQMNTSQIQETPTIAPDIREAWYNTITKTLESTFIFPNQEYRPILANIESMWKR